MDTWSIVSKIRHGKVSYKPGDKVICFRRKTNGYPKKIKDNVEYTIRSIHHDHLIVNLVVDPVSPWPSKDDIKIHKTYMISKTDLREIKINVILK